MSKRKFPCPYCERKFPTPGDRDVHAEACILQNLAPEPHVETGNPRKDFVKDSGMGRVGGMNRSVNDSVMERIYGGEVCTVNDSDVELLGAGFGDRYARIAGEARLESCPKCGHGSAGIYMDELTEEWTCVICGWHSGSKPALPVIPEPAWPHPSRSRCKLPHRRFFP